MPRNVKILRRNFGKIQDVEEIENVPINPNDLSFIPEPALNPKPSVEQAGTAKRKYDWTPTKARAKNSDPVTLHLSTPERQGNGNFGKKRLAFSGVNEYRDEGQSELPNYFSQSVRNVNPMVLTPRVGGTSGRANRGYLERESTYTQMTPAKSVSKPPYPGFAPLSSLRHPGSARAASYAPISKRISVSSGQLCAVNTVEVSHFDLKEDPSFWMDHNVQVILRVRPLNNFERNTHEYNRCVKQENSQSITWIGGQPETRFTFDHVACETVDQEMLFRMAGLPMVENCLSGYNSCMFAYGQTGSGKTYTMLGQMEDLEFMPSSHRGMTPRIFEFLFARISAEEESRRDEKLKYMCKCSFLEIYNEQITDLLDPTCTNLLLREDVKEGVYVENLSEFEVHSVSDVLRLLIQGSSNRKVGATDMNIESSRSHSVFTCVIESKWERDSTINQRFARLNLVDLAGSERQKSSGAEGERLKEAANINKSLSTLGHVIMLLVDIAQGKPKHVPYRDSRLTFLLQDSLGGNSKTMIIANISPSICCAAETLNTLKFAQRAKLIRNNAVVNENSSRDVAALRHQIWLLKEELFTLKRQSISRRLGFESSSTIGSEENTDVESRTENDKLKSDNLMVCDSERSLGVSSKQLKSLDKMLVGALRREQIAETSVKKLGGEIEQLNRLVHQREEDTRCTKMMLKFREDKIQRMESLLGDLTSVDTYLLKENAALSEEIQILRAKVDKNPEVTRFASENIRLQEQLRKFQDFYEEGERDILMNEVSELRSQLILFLDNNNQHNNSNMDKETTLNVEGNVSFQSELINTMQELAECRIKLNSSLESNAKLSRDIDDLHALLRNKELHINGHHGIVKAVKDVEVPCIVDQVFDTQKYKSKSGILTHAEDILNLELELDILKIMLKEERLSRGKLEEMATSLIQNSQLAQQKEFLASKQYDNAKRDLKKAKSVIEGLESQQLLSLNEIEDLKRCKDHSLELIRKQEVEISALKEQIGRPKYSCFRHSEKDSPLHGQLQKMQASLDKAKGLNMWYQSDHAAQRSNEEEMDIVRRQAEAETVEVIVSLQEELSILQHRVQDKDLKEREAENKQLILETKSKELQETLDMMSQDNGDLRQNLNDKDMELKSLTDDWHILSSEIEGILLEGNNTLRSICDNVNSISYHFPDKRVQLSEQMRSMIRYISEKESVILELNRCLKDANIRVNDMEHMLVSLRGAAIVMTESYEQDCYEKEKEILELRSELSRKTSTIAELEKRMKLGRDELMKTSTCATTAFVVVNRLSETNYCHLDTLRIMDKRPRELQEMHQKKDVSLETLKVSSDHCTNLRKQLDEQHRYISTLERRIEDNDKYAIVKAREILEDYKIGVSMMRSSMNEYQEQVAYPEIHNSGVLSVDGFNREALHEFELVEAKTRDQKVAEPSCLLAEFEEARDKMNNAYIMINNLTLANTTMKLEIETLKKINVMLTGEKDSLITEVQELQSSCELKDHNIDNLEQQFEWDVSKITSFVEDLEQSFSETQSISEEILMSFARGFNHMKSQIQDAVKLMHSSLEEISSEVLVKDCALSVTHLCHMGVLLDAIMGLNSENKLLHVGILDSNALISNLKEHNMKVREELETCQMLDGKLLADIRINFDYISSKEDQTRELSMKLSNFSEKLQILRHQEELMLERSNIMNSELDSLTEKLDRSNSTVMASLSKQESLLKSNEEDMKSQIENFLLELNSKDLELVILVSKLNQLAHCNADMEKEVIACCSALDYFIADVVTLRVVLDLREQLLLEMQSKVICLQTISEEAKDGEATVLTKLQKLEEEHKTLKDHMRVKEKEKESFRNRLQEMEGRNCTLMKDLYEKDFESKSCIDMLKSQNCRLEEDIFTFESRFTLVENDLKIKKAELDDMTKTLHKKSQDFASCAAKANAMQDENFILSDELSYLRRSAFEALGTSSSTLAKCINYIETADLQSFTMLERLDRNAKLLFDKISENACQNLDVASGFLQELEVLDSNVRGLVSENLCLQEELSRKDEVLNGLLIDLRLLEESEVNSKDQADEIEKLKATLESTEGELAMRSRELDEAVADGQTLGAKVKEQIGVASALEMDLEKANQSLKCLSGENMELRSRVEDLMTARASADRELIEKRDVIDSLENELLEMGNTLGQMNDLVESLKSNLVEVSSEKDQLQKEVMVLEEKVETAHALVEENEFIATECQQIAESRRIYAEEKEEEVKLFEGSVQELGSTISALENKVGILKEDADRQKAQREVLELELHSLKTDVHIIASPDADREIAECKTHIVELTVLAEEQASRLERAESFLLQVMEELVQYRACSGTSPSINVNEVQRLNKKLKGTDKRKGCT